MNHLRKIIRVNKNNKSEYPFSIEAINKLNEVEFKSNVIFFIGENGSGKTTFLETLVYLCEIPLLIPDEFVYFEYAKQLSENFKISWTKKTRKGFYLKSQSFISYVNNIKKIKEESYLSIQEIKEEYKNRSIKALNLALLPYLRTIGELENLYGIGLDKMSHGESYLELFKSRLKPNSLYLLDEPELSLSPIRQFALISLIKDMVKQNCQFIIITHSPILMAIEGSEIYNFDDNFKKIKYKNIEHVRITKEFLDNPKIFLSKL